MLKFYIFILLLCSSTLYSQTIHGRVYDSEETIKGAKIINTSGKKVIYSNVDGEFSIQASINDTIIFSSYFHKQQSLLVRATHFKNIVIIELKKETNTLTEVLLTNETPKEFNSKIYSQNLDLQIKNDIKENPHLYQQAPSGNLDLIKISSLIIKLFKSKKSKEVPLTPVNYKQYDSLFVNDNFFNAKLLTTSLNISEEYKSLFFDYCEGKQLNNQLLLKSNHIVLLDSLVKFSSDFLKIVDTYNKSK